MAFSIAAMNTLVISSATSRRLVATLPWLLLATRPRVFVAGIPAPSAVVVYISSISYRCSSRQLVCQHGSAELSASAQVRARLEN